jgi:hypothetical protein
VGWWVRVRKHGGWWGGWFLCLLASLLLASETDQRTTGTHALSERPSGACEVCLSVLLGIAGQAGHPVLCLAGCLENN